MLRRKARLSPRSAFEGREPGLSAPTKYGLIVTCAPKATLRNVGYFKVLCLHQSGTDGSTPVPSSRKPVSLGISPLHDEREAALGVTDLQWPGLCETRTLRWRAVDSNLRFPYSP